MPVCKHCGTSVRIITPEDRPDEPDLWGEWTHAEIASDILGSEISGLANHGYFFGCRNYLKGCSELAEPSIYCSEEYAEKFEALEEE